MGATEGAMWKVLAAAAKSIPGRYTRIETGDTALGVSDIEYVTPNFHGWVESKVLMTSRDTSTFMFGTPYSSTQLLWLLEHHNPKRCLCSWLLVGKPKRLALGWDKWFLIPAPITSRLLSTHRPTIGEVVQWPEISVLSSPEEVIYRLNLGTQGNG